MPVWGRKLLLTRPAWWLVLCLGLMLTLGTLLWYAVAIMLLTTPLLWWQQHRQQRSLRLN